MVTVRHIFFEPVWFQKAMLCIEGHKCSDLRTLRALFTDFFCTTFSPKHIVVVINRPIEMKVFFNTKPNVTEPARSSLKLFVQQIAHRDSLLFILLLQHIVSWNSKRKEWIFPHYSQKCSWSLPNSWVRIR